MSSARPATEAGPCERGPPCCAQLSSLVCRHAARAVEICIRPVAPCRKRERQASHLCRNLQSGCPPWAPGLPGCPSAPGRAALGARSEKKPTTSSLPPPFLLLLCLSACVLSPTSGFLFQTLFFCGRVLSRTKKVSAWFSPSTRSSPVHRRNRRRLAYLHQHHTHWTISPSLYPLF